MNLTSDQQRAVDSIQALQTSHSGGGGVGIISGFAGTGKSFLLGSLVEEYEKDLLVCAPTGKAAVRVREIAGATAKTIHSWLYDVEEDPKTGVLRWGLKNPNLIERPMCGYLVVDEASMVTYQVFLDLYRTCKQIDLNLVLVGDPFQLPPVDDPAKAGFSVFAPELPSVFRVDLTEIHRQALDSPIIRTSMAVRQNRSPGEALTSLPMVMESKLRQAAKETWESEGALIVHRNATRHTLNCNIRQDSGRPEGRVEKGEPLLVIQNNYPLEVFNGEVVDVLSQPVPINDAPVAVHDPHTTSSTYVNYLTVEIDTPLKGKAAVCVSDKEVFGDLGGVGAHVVRRVGRKLVNTEYGFSDEGYPLGPPYLSANLGYVLTCHKAQGSEWTHGIVVIEPTIRLNSVEGRRWIYTALTRMKKSVEICWATH